MGHAPESLAAVIGAILSYDHPGGEKAVELQRTVWAKGERASPARYAGIVEDHPLTNLVIEKEESAW